jgi:hypothetical protein
MGEPTALESEVLRLIEVEVTRRTQLKVMETLALVSNLYEIPLERLVKDTAGLECSFCKGINKKKERCLKKPQENGYCGFHRRQCPGYKSPEKVEEKEVSAPWD